MSTQLPIITKEQQWSSNNKKSLTIDKSNKPNNRKYS